jgi:transposase
MRLALHAEVDAHDNDDVSGARGATRAQQVEPNSGLGKAYEYMLKRWDKLTLFLQRPGAPLENNICERALKMAIAQRRNSLFYRTQHGQRR